MFTTLLTALCLMGNAQADSLSVSETSYSGASILEGDSDVTFEGSFDIAESEGRFPYAFFEGNTLYVGNSDIYDNTIDAIVEFFWFQSSIDRGTDFYVAVIKTRVTPGHDCYYAPWDWARGAQCKLWADEWSDWGEYPVLSVEAMTDVEREQGAFRWDWSVPFESYGIDAYGQVTFQNKYGIGSDSEGAIMAHGAYPITEDGEIKADGTVQVKGFHSSDYSVQTQYEVTLYEWDVFVDGRADLMAWDMYLNLGARETQSAYHEYFLSVQVEEGKPFRIDELNFIGNFDTGWYDPFHHELGVTLSDVVISQPHFIPTEDEEKPDEQAEEDSSSPPEEQDTASDHEESDEDTAHDSELIFSDSKSTKEESKGCSTVITRANYMTILLSLLAVVRRRR
jgi:hypothetical protein